MASIGPWRVLQLNEDGTLPDETLGQIVGSLDLPVLVDQTIDEADIPGQVQAAFNTAGVVTGAGVATGGGLTTWAHTTDPDAFGRVKRKPLGYTDFGLDAYARLVWLRDVNDTREDPDHPIWKSVVIGDDNKIIKGVRWDGSAYPAATTVVTPITTVDRPAPESARSNRSLALSPADSWVRGGEFLQVLPDMDHLIAVGSSTIAGMTAQFQALATQLGFTYVKCSLGGIVAKHQGAMLGSHPALLDAFTMPATATATVVTTPTLPVNTFTGISYTGRVGVDGRHGTLSKAEGGSEPFLFTPDSAGSTESIPKGTPFIPDVAQYRGSTVLFNPIKNDATQNVIGYLPMDDALKMVDEMVDWLSPLVKRVVMMDHYVDTDIPVSSAYRDRILYGNKHWYKRYGAGSIGVLRQGAYITGEQVWTDTNLTPTGTLPTPAVNTDRYQQSIGNKPYQLSAYNPGTYPTGTVDPLHLSDVAKTAVAQNLIKPYLTTKTGWYSA